MNKTESVLCQIAGIFSQRSLFKTVNKDKVPDETKLRDTSCMILG